jgi:Fe-S-cluster containining protein
MSLPPRNRPRREEVPSGQSLCAYCTAKCCRYFALPLETPTRRRDFDTLRWFLLHEHTSIFVEKGTWYLQVHTPCRELRPDHRCGIYADRPQICRRHSTKNCEYEDDWVYDLFFESPAQLEEYVEARFPRRGPPFRSARPQLPLIG